MTDGGVGMNPPPYGVFMVKITYEIDESKSKYVIGHKAQSKANDVRCNLSIMFIVSSFRAKRKRKMRKEPFCRKEVNWF